MTLASAARLFGQVTDHLTNCEWQMPRNGFNKVMNENGFQNLKKMEQIEIEIEIESARGRLRHL